MGLLGIAGVACADPLPPELSLEGNRVSLRSERPLQRVVVLDPEGVPLSTRRLAGEATEVSLDLPRGAPGRYTLELSTVDGERFERSVDLVAPAFPVEVRVAAPAGLEVPVHPGDGVDVAVALVAWETASFTVDLGDGPTLLHLRADERWSAVVPLDGPRTVDLLVGFEEFSAELVPVEQDPAELAERLVLRSLTFPANLAGEADIARPRGRVGLASGWWRSLLGSFGLGVRARDALAPWSYQALTLENRGERDLNVVVEAEVLDGEGAQAAPFRARLRGGQDQSGKVRVLLRVPAGEQARASLPFHVDEAALDGLDLSQQVWTRRLTISPLGSERPLQVVEEPLYVSRGSTVASLGLVVAFGAAILGAGLLALRGRRWLEERATSELMTISLFGALTFLVGAVGRLLTMGLAALLGPFATLLTNLVDDAFRYTLLATLITLLPRPGTGALAVLTGWLLSGIALGAFSATDVLFIGSRVLWLEGALYLFGLTRETGWREQSAVARWVRLSLGFGVASVLTSATGLVLHVTLYRLFFADWYVAMLLIGPGFLYVVLACALAVPFAESLRRIQR